MPGGVCTKNARRPLGDVLESEMARDGIAKLGRQQKVTALYRLTLAGRLCAVGGAGAPATVMTKPPVRCRGRTDSALLRLPQAVRGSLWWLWLAKVYWQLPANYPDGDPWCDHTNQPTLFQR